MSNLSVVSVFPSNLAQDIVLGTKIIVTFSALIDMNTVTPSTFSLTGPAQTQILTPTQLIQSDPSYINGRQYISGVFTSKVDPNNSTQTIVTFTPSTPLQPNTTYTLLLVGLGAILVSDSIKDTNGNSLSANYQWTFSTGTLNTTLPPAQAPTPYQYAAIDPAKIHIKVNNLSVGNLLNQNLGNNYQISLIFPNPIDQTSFDPNDILLSIEPFLGDPTLNIPENLTPSISIVGNTIQINLQSL